MSFDVSIYFTELPDDFAAKLQAVLRDLQMQETVLIPPDWEDKGFWYFLDSPSDNPEDGLIVEVGPVVREQLEGQQHPADELALLSTARYCAFVSTRMSAGSAALKIAGSIAKVTGGIVLDCQGAAFEDALGLAAQRGPRGPEGNPTLAERGIYDAPLAWEVAKAAGAYEQRLAAGSAKAPPAAPSQAPVSQAPPRKHSISPMSIVLGIAFLLWAVFKLHKAGYF